VAQTYLLWRESSRSVSVCDVVLTWPKEPFTPFLRSREFRNVSAEELGSQEQLEARYEL